jgi:oxidase EvaA
LSEIIFNEEQKAKSEKYSNDFKVFKDSIDKFNYNFDEEKCIEHYFQSLNDWNLFHDIEHVKKWFTNAREKSEMKIEVVPLKEIKGWIIDEETGNLKHESGEFFEVFGLRVTNSNTREVGAVGWDQPILIQVGYDGGLLGILMKRFLGVPHYLIEAKEEPGNYDLMLLSPTLQATFSNLKKAHKGKKPRFAELFEEPDKYGCNVIVENWLSEDGGRLYLKRNYGMIVEVDEDFQIDYDDNFIWMSIYQIKELLRTENAWINPHIRGIISML